MEKNHFIISYNENGHRPVDKTISLEQKLMITPLKYKPEATEGDIPESWRDVKNNLFFTKGYTDIFKDNMIAGLWIAYFSFTKIFEKYPGPDFLAPYMHVFTYKRKKFWITKEAERVIFSTPDEY